MAIKLYGIKQNLGKYIEYKEEDSIDRPPIDGIDDEKYKDFIKGKTSGGVTVFRGFENARLLASISESIKDYQRGIDNLHREKLKQYLLQSTPDSVYFPEVTLLYEFDAELDPDELNIQSIIHPYETKKNIDVDLLSKLWGIGLSVLTLEDNEKLYRLDGNHRLSVLQELANGMKINPDKGRRPYNIHTENRMISYCIILVPKTGEYSFEHLYFYLLNSKSLPITPLKNIDMLLSDTISNEHINFIKNDSFLHIMNELKVYWINFTDEEKECLIGVVHELQKVKDDSNEKKPKHTSEQIIIFCKEALGLYRAPLNVTYIGICCFIRSNTKNTTEAQERLSDFQKWVRIFDYDVTHFKNMSDLYESFKKYDENRKKTKYIFVAMQWNEKYVNAYKNAINDVINRIKGRNRDIVFELLPIMQPSAGGNILNEIIENIKKCDVFIADVSTNNGNVLLEYGFAKGLEKFIYILASEDWKNETLMALDIKENPTVEKLHNDLQTGIFDLKVINCCPWKEENDLKEKLEKTFGEFLKEYSFV